MTVENILEFRVIRSRETDLVVQFQATPVRLELLKTIFAHLADTTNGNEGRATKTPWSDLVEGR